MRSLVTENCTKYCRWRCLLILVIAALVVAGAGAIGAAICNAACALRWIPNSVIFNVELDCGMAVPPPPRGPYLFYFLFE